MGPRNYFYGRLVSRWWSRRMCLTLFLRDHPNHNHWTAIDLKCWNLPEKILTFKDKRENSETGGGVLLQWNQIWYTTGEQTTNWGKKITTEVSLQERKILSPSQASQPWGPAMEESPENLTLKAKGVSSQKFHRTENRNSTLECTYKVLYAPGLKVE